MPFNRALIVPTWCFSVVVVQKQERFLLIQEAKHGNCWYLPAGRLEPGETFMDAAIRETLEESGVPITLTGVISVEMSNHNASRRIRTIFTGAPIDETLPKTDADEHSLRAEWVSAEDLDRLRLRASDVIPLVRHVATGGLVHPISVFSAEGSMLRGQSSA